MTTQVPPGDGSGQWAVHDTPPTGPRELRWRPVATQAALTLAVFVAAGAACGWLWHRLWAPAPEGVALEGRWIPLPPVGSAAEFGGTGWFVVVAVLAGLVLGVLVALVLDREELVTVAAVAVGSLLAAWVMYRVGVSLAPPDPEPLARVAEDGTRITGTLAVAGPVAFGAWPLGALLGVGGTFLVVFGARGTGLDNPLDRRRHEG